MTRAALAAKSLTATVAHAGWPEEGGVRYSREQH